MNTRCAALLAVALAACAPERGVAMPQPSRLVLCVENASVAMGTARVRAGQTTWRVEPGRTECKPVEPGAGNVRVLAETMGGGANGPLRWSGQLSRGILCWHLRVENTHTAMGLTDCDFRRRARDEAGAWVRVEQYAKEARYLGFTRWDNETLTPYAFINRRVIGTAWEAEVVAHEDVHMRQFSRFRTLADLRAAAERDAMAWEAEAFCAQAAAAVLSGRIATIEQAVAEMAFNLASPNYGFGIDVASAASLILRNCRAT